VTLVPRSNRREVRNPLLGLPSAALIADLPLPAKIALRSMLDDIAKAAAERAQTSWRQNKGPMAAYRKAVSVYAKHLRAMCSHP